MNVLMSLLNTHVGHVGA